MAVPAPLLSPAQMEDGMKIGFIGLGRMGGHVAANLLKAGHR